MLTRATAPLRHCATIIYCIYSYEGSGVAAAADTANADAPNAVAAGPRASYSGTGARRLDALQHRPANLSNTIDAIVVQTPARTPTLSPPVLPPVHVQAAAATAGKGGRVPAGGGAGAGVGDTDQPIAAGADPGLAMARGGGKAAAARSVSYEEYRMRMEGSVARTASTLSGSSAVFAAAAAGSTSMASSGGHAAGLGGSGGDPKVAATPLAIGPLGTAPVSVEAAAAAAAAANGEAHAEQRVLLAVRTNRCV